MNAPQTALAQVLPKIHLNVLSNSALGCYRECPRKFKYKYVMKRRARRSSEALRFGTFCHVGLEAWWLAKGDASDRLHAALEAMQTRAEARPEDADPFALVKAEVLMIGYTARWGHARYEVLAVEKQFSAELVNPISGRPSKTYRLEGKIDVVVRNLETGKIENIEHKTTSEDIGLGADYWRMVSTLDSQVSTYMVGARAAGFDVDICTYDVLRKVGLRPFSATPEEDRKYTQEKSKQCPFCKKKCNVPGPHKVSADDEEPVVYCVDGKIVTEAGGRLYANQHDHDETPEEFRERVMAEIMGKPEKYFARGPIVRLEADEREHAGDVWQTAWQIRESENASRFPRNPGACKKFGHFCEYFDVCSGQASIDDDMRFRSAEHAHEELAEV